RIKTVTTSGISTNFVTFFYLPVYKHGAAVTNNVDERRQNALGVIYMTIFPQKMLASLSPEMENPGVDFDIYDGPKADPEKKFFDADAVSPTNHLKLNPTITRQVV